MKKLHTILAGIVFLITILAAGACKKKPEQMGEVAAANDTAVVLFLKDRSIHGSMHLEMSDSRKPDCVVIDNLETEVFPGDSVIFRHAKKSNIDEVIDISLEIEDVKIFSESDSKVSYLYLLIIDSLAPTDTIIKYDIVFKVKHDTTTYTIDPYLRIPPKP